MAQCISVKEARQQHTKFILVQNKNIDKVIIEARNKYCRYLHIQFMKSKRKDCNTSICDLI
jgi:hypothetical protein